MGIRQALIASGVCVAVAVGPPPAGGAVGGAAPVRAPAASSAEPAAGHCVAATNNHNTEYTVDIMIGTPGQRLRVVADSGSADLLLDSTDCMDCSGEHFQFDKTKSTTFTQGNGVMPLAYGQGVVMCETANDVVSIGGAKAPNASVLLMAMNGLQGFDQAPYDGVMGLGPQSNDGDGTGVSMLKMMGEDTFSICFGQSDKSPGRLVIGGEIPTGSKEVSIPAVGHDYWSLYMTEAKIGGVVLPATDCYPHCVAVIDSGTSLIGMPTQLLEHINMKIGNVEPDCSNVAELPPVAVTLGGEEFLLPPEIYVVKVDNSTASANTAVASLLERSPFGLDNLLGKPRMPRGHAGKPARPARPRAPSAEAPSTNEVCVSAFFQMDQPSEDGPMVIFGIPFLRAYAARFSRGMGDGTRMIGLASVPKGSAICEACPEDSAAATPPEVAVAPPKAGHGRAMQPPAGLAAPPAGAGGPPTGAGSGPVSIKLEHLRMPWWTVPNANSTRHDSQGRIRL